MGDHLPLSKRIWALVYFLSGIAWPYFWEFVRSWIYERFQHMMEPFIPSYDVALHYGPAIALVVLGLWLFYHSGRAVQSTKPQPVTTILQGENAALTISSPYLLPEPDYVNKNRWRMRVHNNGTVVARNVQMKLQSAASQPKDTRWGADYPYFVYPVGTIMNDAGHLSRPERKINPNDYENYEITMGWKSEAGGFFFTSVNTKGGGHNDIQIQPGERWQFFYDVTAENADPLSFTLHIFLEDDQVKVSRVS
jgi:hypothetical protein